MQMCCYIFKIKQLIEKLEPIIMVTANAIAFNKITHAPYPGRILFKPVVGTATMDVQVTESFSLKGVIVDGMEQCEMFY